MRLLAFRALVRPSPSSPVALVRCVSYHPDLTDAVDGLCRAVDFAPPRGARVLLKPNLVAASRADGLAVTHPQVVRAVAIWCLEHGARVSVGDSPAFGSGRAVMASTGILAALEGLPVRIAPFAGGPVLPLMGGGTVRVAEDVFAHDLLINLPKLKAHCQMRVSLAVKNYFGLVLAWRKVMAHMRLGDDGRFPRLLVDLLALLPPGLTVVDGVVAMHRTGPMDGEPLSLGLLAASPNPVAMDTALLAVLGLEPRLSPLWRECAERGLPGSRLDEIVFPLLPPDAWQGAGFVAPAGLDPVRFHLRRFARSSVRRIFRAAMNLVGR